MKKLLVFLLMPVAISALTACGGGSGAATASQPVSASLALSTSGTGTAIYGIGVSVVLPAGVSVKSTAVPPLTDEGVVSATGQAAGSLISAVYSSATATAPGMVKIMVVNGTGFATGEFATVYCDIAAWHWPKPADFSLADFTAIDMYGNAIPGAAAGFSADIR